LEIPKITDAAIAMAHCTGDKWYWCKYSGIINLGFTLGF
jgi:hypothetical protein